jgi:hypothetical protein
VLAILFFILEDSNTLFHEAYTGMYLHPLAVDGSLVSEGILAVEALAFLFSKIQSKR